MTTNQGAKRSKLGSRGFFGALVIVIGVIFLLNTTGISDLGGLLDWWPSLIILYGAWRLAANRFRSLFWPLLLIAIGALLQLRQLDIIPGIDFGTYWPLILIAVGIGILARGFTRRNRRRRSSTSHNASTIIDVRCDALSFPTTGSVSLAATLAVLFTSVV